MKMNMAIPDLLYGSLHAKKNKIKKDIISIIFLFAVCNWEASLTFKQSLG
jgi:hypothetical protein